MAVTFVVCEAGLLAPHTTCVSGIAKGEPW